jgi:glycosyltransferase involved in cell wall biosynthesis
MRVALVTENFLPKLDGVTRTLVMLLEHLERRKHPTIVLGPQGGPRQYAGARIFGAPGLPLPLYPELRMLFPAADLGRRLACFQPDIVHVVDPMLLGAAGIRWAQRLEVPVVSSYHTNLAAYCAHYHLGALTATTWAYRRFLHNQCSVTLCPSPSTAGQLKQHGFARVGLWTRGVDSRLFHPARRSETWRLRVTGDASSRIVLYVGRLSPEKNLGTLAAAFRALASADAQAHLVLVGDGPSRDDLARALDGLRVTFTGYLRGDALAEAYASADVFAFPSTTETFGQVVQEAMASGLPVIACDAEGVRDLVRHDQTGLLVSTGDAHMFSDTLCRLLASSEQRTRMGTRARELAEQRTWEHIMNTLLDTYARLAGDQETTQAA